LCNRCIAKAKAKRQDIKRRCMGGYGGRCACCGESRLDFLTIDHVHNDGAEKRAIGHYPGGGSGPGFYRWVVNHDFPDDLQCLCCNCNWAKKLHGKCPHHSHGLCLGDGEGI